MTAIPSVTDMLAKAQPGQGQSLEALLPLVYGELRALAASYLRQDHGRTLQPTALVHEAFIKMVGNDREWSGKDHFKAVAAKAMRQVLVDHFRRRHASKRGGDAERASISIEHCGGLDDSSREMQVQELDELLTILAKTSPRVAGIAEMRLFGGMDTDQIGRVMGVAEATVRRDWQVARAWLASQILRDGRA